MGRIHHYLGVLFQCCQVYRRIYINKQGTAYEGACPRCGRMARVLASSVDRGDRSQGPR